MLFLAVAMEAFERSYAEMDHEHSGRIMANVRVHHSSVMPLGAEGTGRKRYSGRPSKRSSFQSVRTTLQSTIDAAAEPACNSSASEESSGCDRHQPLLMQPVLHSGQGHAETFPECYVRSSLAVRGCQRPSCVPVLDLGAVSLASDAVHSGVLDHSDGSSTGDVTSSDGISNTSPHSAGTGHTDKGTGSCSSSTPGAFGLFSLMRASAAQPQGDRASPATGSSFFFRRSRAKTHTAVTGHSRLLPCVPESNAPSLPGEHSGLSLHNDEPATGPAAPLHTMPGQNTATWNPDTCTAVESVLSSPGGTPPPPPLVQASVPSHDPSALSSVREDEDAILREPSPSAPVGVQFRPGTWKANSLKEYDPIHNKSVSPSTSQDEASPTLSAASRKSMRSRSVRIADIPLITEDSAGDSDEFVIEVEYACSQDVINRTQQVQELVKRLRKRKQRERTMEALSQRSRPVPPHMQEAHKLSPVETWVPSAAASASHAGSAQFSGCLSAAVQGHEYSHDRLSSALFRHHSPTEQGMEEILPTNSHEVVPVFDSASGSGSVRDWNSPQQWCHDESVRTLRRQKFNKMVNKIRAVNKHSAVCCGISCIIT
jgi:hypothetical protein